MIATHTVPSLQGTLAKRTKPTLQPNFAKEPFRPSRPNAGLRDSANMIDKQIEDKNRQCLRPVIRNYSVNPYKLPSVDYLSSPHELTSVGHSLGLHELPLVNNMIGPHELPAVGCRVEGLLMAVPLDIFRVTRQTSAHESATAHAGEHCKQF